MLEKPLASLSALLAPAILLGAPAVRRHGGGTMPQVFDTSPNATLGQRPVLRPEALTLGRCSFPRTVVPPPRTMEPLSPLVPFLPLPPRSGNLPLVVGYRHDRPVMYRLLKRAPALGHAVQCPQDPCASNQFQSLEYWSPSLHWGHIAHTGLAW